MSAAILGSDSSNILLKDLFTDSNGVSLASHRMTVGSGWTIYTGTITVENNKASTGVTARAGANAGKSDGTITVKCVPQADSRVGIMFRHTDSNNFWAFRLRPPVDVEIIEVTSASENTRAGVTMDINPGQEYLLQLSLIGTSIVGTVDGAHRVSYESAVRMLVTNHGLYSVGTADPRTFDDFLMTK